MSEPLNIDKLAPGDILLYRASDRIQNALSALIRKLDGTEVSHAGLYIGNGIVAEALARGLVAQRVADSIKADFDWVAVRRLKYSPGPMTPVLAVARKYLDQHNRYAFEQIMLLAGICLTRKFDDNWLLRRIARTVFDRSAALLERFRKDGKEPMICSEFVFRTYDEALPGADDPYSLEILSQKAGEPRRFFSRFRRRTGLFGGETPSESPANHPDSLLERLQAAGDTPGRLLASADKMAASMPRPEEDLDSLIEQYLAEAEGTKSAGPPAVATGRTVSTDELLDSARRLTAELAEAAARKAETLDKVHGVQADRVEAAPRTLADIVADFVTPGDLLKSPSLKEVGTIRP